MCLFNNQSLLFMHSNAFKDKLIKFIDIFLDFFVIKGSRSLKILGHKEYECVFFRTFRSRYGYNLAPKWQLNICFFTIKCYINVQITDS